jgi:peroxiredoxin
MLAAGDRAPDFEIAAAEGGRKALKDLLASGPVLIAFYKVSCPICQFTFPFLERLHRAGVNVVGVSQDDAESTREFSEEFGLTLPMLVDDRGYPASNGFGLAHVPSIFLVEAGGAVAMASDGFVRQDLEEVARRSGVALFKPGEYVPEWKAG